MRLCLLICCYIICSTINPNVNISIWGLTFVGILFFVLDLAGLVERGTNGES